jgi:tetratricopeptide (TPR) repeat protein
MAAHRVKAVWALIVLWLACEPFAGAQNSGKTVRHHRVAEAPADAGIGDAEAAIDRKDYAQAEQLLKQALAAHTDDYRAWFDLGFVLKAQGRDPEAIEAYRKAVAANPAVFESNLNLGLMLAQAGNPDAATFLRAATQLKPTTHPEEGLERAWLSLGHVLEAASPQEALSAYRQAERFQPADPEPHLAAALLLEHRGDYAGAEDEYQRVTMLAPKSTEALAGLVNVYQKTGRMPEAEGALRKYLALVPQSGATHIQLGRVLAAEGKTEEASTELQTGMKLSPDDAAVLREAAEVFAAAKNYPQAEEAFRMLVQRNANDAEAHQGLGSALMHQRKFVEAQSELEAALKLNPRLADAYGDLAITASENKDYVLTLRALAIRAKLLPETPATYFLRAVAYDHLKDTQHAAENYRQFLEVANGRFPDQEWQARHRLIAIEPKKK